jgi:hypothetical protein
MVTNSMVKALTPDPKPRLVSCAWRGSVAAVNKRVALVSERVGE